MRNAYRICAVSAALLLLALPAPVRADTSQEAMFQDNMLLLGDPGHLDRTLRTLANLGVDRLRITVGWSTIASDPNSPRRPHGFDPADPAAYPPANWTRYDAIVSAARRYRLGVDFNLTGAAPLWAVGRAPAPSLLHVWQPSASEFGAFVRAVGIRYSGTYIAPGARGPLPRVDYWSIWNEPNVGASSLAPQTVGGTEVSPRLYRRLLRAAYAALLRTGHARDTILVGETASTGHLDPGASLGMPPLRFLRALYCVDLSYRPLRGRAAARRGCPVSARGSRGFRAANPALFDATGWGHHPYDLTTAPDVPAPAVDPDWVPLANLPRLERALDRIHRDYGSHRRYPIYLTEYGIETNPPRADFPISPALQAAYLNQADYMTWRDPRVRVMTQYLLRDSPPGGGSTVSSFASGLRFADGRKKPSFDAYKLALWLPRVRSAHGHPLEVWGRVGPAKRSPRREVGSVEIQLDRQTIDSIPISNPRGYFDVRVTFPHSGSVRLAWRRPGGPTVYSRLVVVTQTSSGSSELAAPLAIVAAALLALTGYGVLRHRRTRTYRRA